MTARASLSRTILAEIERVARDIRVDALRLSMRPGGGYLTQACGSAEILATLYVALLDLGTPAVGPSPDPFSGVPRIGRAATWGGAYHGASDPARDRFIVSPAHYAMAVYAGLVAVGRLSRSALETYASDGSVLEMVGAEHSPGMEVTSGSLGQALSVGIGQALARARRRDAGRIWVLLSDGEMQEGQTWEALQAAAHFRLDGLTVLLDANGYQVDGPTASVMGVEPIVDKIRAFGWTVHEVDGHDPAAIASAAMPSDEPAPTLIVCRTVPWTGIPSLQARHPRRLHYIRFAPEERAAAMADLGLDALPA